MSLTNTFSDLCKSFAPDAFAINYTCLLYTSTFVYGLVTFITGFATFIPYGFLYAISLGGGVLTALTVLLTLPTIMLVARRLRDSNNDPTLMILVFVPILGWLVLL